MALSSGGVASGTVLSSGGFLADSGGMLVSTVISSGANDVVSSGGTLTLLGQYVTGQFHMATDGHGGTLVTDPPVDSAGHLTSPH
jgi:hypothetical protein